MKRKIICVVLILIVAVLSASCKNDEKVDILNKPIIVSSSDPGHVAAAREYKTSIGGDFVNYTSSSDAVMAVINGKADYVVLDEYSGYTFTEENDELILSEKCEYSIEYSACFSIGRTELCEKFNETFASVKEDGTIDKIKSAVYEKTDYVVNESTGEKGVLVMLCDPVFENRVYFDEDGSVKGVDVYIAQEVCNRLGYRLIIETNKFDDLFTSLDNGEADFIMSCVERTEERSEHYLFSDVYATYDYNVYKLK